MKTRKEYLNNECTHRQYYAEFVQPYVLAAISARFTNAELAKALSEDEHFNTIPLPVWDSLGDQIRYSPLFDIAKQKGEAITKSTLCCIVKEGAKQLAEIG
jgi:hypothetical protein